MSKPLLSICIPTYNRAKYLKESIDSIIGQKEFDDRTEIVISDNCSTDNTQKLCEFYTSKYNNIHYFRNSENLQDTNFSLSLQRANGYARKLSNDTIIYDKDAIGYMISAIQENIEERPQLFFLNSGENKYDPIKANTLDDYLDIIGYHITWIGALAVWEDDCNDLELLVKNAESKLAQVPFLLDNFERRGYAAVYDKVIMTTNMPSIKNVSYGIYHVFYETFIGFLMDYEKSGKISDRCIECVRKRLLLDFFSIWIVDIEFNRGRFLVSDEDLRRLVENEYNNVPYFMRYKIKILYLRLKAILKVILGKI